LQTEDILPGTYVLDVNSPSLNFSEKIFLYRESYTFSVLIETDKPVYKPGNTVKFRVLVLDSATYPIHVEAALTVAVSDASDNREQIWNHVSAPHGIYNNEYKLEATNDLNLGLWKIEVEYKDKVEEKKFFKSTNHYLLIFQIIKKTVEVTEYVLPRFQVQVLSPKCMHVHVLATYPNGKPVAGSAIIKATPILSCSGSWKKLAEPITKSVKCVGKAHVVFDRHDFSNQTRSILIEVTVQESATGLVVQSSDVIFPHTNPKSELSGPHKKSLHAELINQPNLHKNIKVKVTSKDKLATLFYYVVGAGKILLSKALHCRHSHESLIEFKPIDLMAPKSQLVVYYIRANGKIVSDVLELEFPYQFSNNFVSFCKH
jgi:hypothetical protein